METNSYSHNAISSSEHRASKLQVLEEFIKFYWSLSPTHD